MKRLNFLDPIFHLSCDIVTIHQHGNPSRASKLSISVIGSCEAESELLKMIGKLLSRLVSLGRYHLLLFLIHTLINDFQIRPKGTPNYWWSKKFLTRHWARFHRTTSFVKSWVLSGISKALCVSLSFYVNRRRWKLKVFIWPRMTCQKYFVTWLQRTSLHSILLCFIAHSERSWGKKGFKGLCDIENSV